MATTPNYGWVTPAPTDFVTDLPADFETFADAVDADLAGLLGGTTGQILAKDSNADHDFSWVSSSGIQATILDAKGDLIAASAADTAARLAVGTDGQILSADSSAATGLAWINQKIVQAVSATTSTATSNSTTTYADTGLTATITPTSASNKILVIWYQGGCAKSAGNASNEVECRLRRNSTTIANQSAGFTNSALVNEVGAIGAVILDNPATTSALTYKTEFRNGFNGASVTVQDGSSLSSILLVEVDL